MVSYIYSYKNICYLLILKGLSWTKLTMEKAFIVVQLLSYVPLFCKSTECSLPDSSVHGIFQQEYWSGLPFPSPGELLDPRIKLMSPALAGRFFTTEPPGKPQRTYSAGNKTASVLSEAGGQGKRQTMKQTRKQANV